MQAQERESLTQFLQQLSQSQAPAKDAEAQALIADAFARQPDAAYLVVQRALLLDMACNEASAQIAQLKEQLAERQRTQAAPPASGFLDANSWGRQPAVASLARPADMPTPARPAGAFAPQGLPATPALPLQSTAGFSSPGQMAAPPARGFQAPSFLTSMATTAAGVAAGAFLFQGINHLTGNHHGAGLGNNDASAKPAETPASHSFANLPDDAGSNVANNNTAGFDELLDIGGGGDGDGPDSGAGGDGNDWA